MREGEAALNSGARVLVVDDEAGMRRTLAGYLGYAGYRVQEAESGRQALECLQRESFDLVILDLNMPGMHGTEVLQLARPLCPQTAFIILTAYGTLDSAILALRHGAFDYLLKPASVQEITAVVGSAIAQRKRQQGDEDPVALLERALAHLRAAEGQVTALAPGERFLQGAEVTIDTLKQLVVVAGRPVELTPTEYGVLVYLLRHRNRVVSCRELVAHVQGLELDERDARIVLRSHIHRLRCKVECDAACPALVCTVRGSGYTFGGG